MTTRRRGLDHIPLGKGAKPFHLEIDDSGGTPRDLTPHVTEVKGLGVSYTVRPATAIDDTAHQAAAGIQEARTFTIKGRFSDQANIGPDVVLPGILGGSPGTVSYGPQGNHSGARKITGEFLCTAYVPENHDTGEITYLATFQQTGPITVTTW